MLIGVGNHNDSIGMISDWKISRAVHVRFPYVSGHPSDALFHEDNHIVRKFLR